MRTWIADEFLNVVSVLSLEPQKEKAEPVAVLRIRDVYPGSRILIFTHPGSRIQKQQQKREVKKLVVIPFYVATNVTKL
jgi:hypothetical protein